eukprot:1091923-Alexandrium_andersonii.AAC.1
MSASLVGSEMCIRDSAWSARQPSTSCWTREQTGSMESSVQLLACASRSLAQVLLAYYRNSSTFIYVVAAALPDSLTSVLKARICAYAIEEAPSWVDYPLLGCADNDPVF